MRCADGARALEGLAQLLWVPAGVSCDAALGEWHVNSGHEVGFSVGGDGVRPQPVEKLLGPNVMPVMELPAQRPQVAGSRWVPHRHLLDSARLQPRAGKARRMEPRVPSVTVSPFSTSHPSWRKPGLFLSGWTPHQSLRGPVLVLAPQVESPLPCTLGISGEHMAHLSA